MCDTVKEVNKLAFVEFPKIARLSRECVITEKIDGTNASIFIGENGEFLVGSRTRWITPEQDNYGFAKWAYEHKEELLKLGVGHHFGEWWGQGIQRKYNVNEKRWSLFNTSRWVKFKGDPVLKEKQEYCPECCDVVPVLYQGIFDTFLIEGLLKTMQEQGSRASPGFMKPEGVVIWHTAARKYFKKTIEKDEQPKVIQNNNV